MSVTLRLSCLAAALAWVPVAGAQLNPPLMGGGSVPAQAASTAPRAPGAAPASTSGSGAGAASVGPPSAGPAAAAATSARPLVRQVPAVPLPPPSPAASSVSVAQAMPVLPPGSSAATQASAPASAPGVAPAAAPAPATAGAAPANDPPRYAGGAGVRGLLALQASGRVAGPARPVLGPAATAAWDRYRDSFTHPIPEWFDRNVEED